MPANFPRTLIAVLTLVMLSLGLSGCFLNPFWDGDKKKEEEPETNEQILYRSAQSSLRAGNYKDAISKLQALESHFPFGRYAEQAQLELIYAHYSSFNHEAARSAADRFIRLHPQHPSADYAYYLKGLSAFNKNRGLLDRIAGSQAHKRDVSAARQAFADFSQLLVLYPASQYAPDARQRMIYLRNLLAASEIAIARYYIRQGALVAAENRARAVVEGFEGSDSVDEALAILVEVNYLLGLEDAADDALRVLAQNFPDHEAFDKEGNFVFQQSIRNSDRSWTNMITFGLLDRPDIPPPIEIHKADDKPLSQDS